MIYIFNRNWVDTRGQQYITHLHTNNIQDTEKGEFGKCVPCPVFASYALAFALQLRKKDGKTSVRVAMRNFAHQRELHIFLLLFIFIYFYLTVLEW
jgi:hypothetical protein